MRALVAILVFVLIAVAAGLGYVYSGTYNVAATERASPPLRWLLETSMEQSVQQHAAGIAVPDLTGEERLRSGAEHYIKQCEVCHGGPGLEKSELARGLHPEPPELGHSARQWSDAELYWIVANGVRMTGMPAWGPSHEPDSIWSIVAFIRSLPELTAERYRALKAQVASPQGHGGAEAGGAGGEAHHAESAGG